MRWIYLVDYLLIIYRVVFLHTDHEIEHADEHSDEHADEHNNGNHEPEVIEAK